MSTTIKESDLESLQDVLPIFFDRIHHSVHKGDYVDAMLTAARVCDLVWDHRKESFEMLWIWTFAQQCRIEMKHRLNAAMRFVLHVELPNQPDTDNRIRLSDNTTDNA